MTRGDVVIARAPGEFTGKARPFVVVQADAMLTDAQIVTVCPVTSILSHADLIRVPLPPGEGTGLRVASEVEVDLLSSLRVARISETVGRVPDAVMGRIDAALRRWLDL